ncbi:MAG: hypothetical protein IKP78_01420 [Ruminococcus sp.]|nr:hypothetical protein [Ruminococcus sp.]
MIVLKILLWILLAVLGIIVLILCLPIRGAVSYIDGKLTYSAHYSLILLYNSDKKGLVSLVLKWKKKRDEKKKAKEEAASAADAPEPYEPPQAETVSEPPAESVTAPAEEKPPQPVEEVKPETADTPATDDPFDDIDEPLEEESSKKKKKKDKPPKTLIEKVDFVLDIVRAADRPILRIFKGVKLYELYIDFIIANEDAYKCALNYGRISGALYNVIAWLSVLFNVKLRTIDINPGFAVDKPRWDAAAKIKFRPITAVAAGAGLLITYLFRFFIPGLLQDRKLRKQAARQK